MKVWSWSYPLLNCYLFLYIFIVFKCQVGGWWVSVFDYFVGGHSVWVRLECDYRAQKGSACVPHHLFLNGDNLSFQMLMMMISVLQSAIMLIACFPSLCWMCFFNRNFSFNVDCLIGKLITNLFINFIFMQVVFIAASYYVWLVLMSLWCIRVYSNDSVPLLCLLAVSTICIFSLSNCLQLIVLKLWLCTIHGDHK